MARSLASTVLAIVLVVVIPSCGACPPAPSLTSLSPSSATAGGAQFLLTINGEDFRHDSVVTWNGSVRVTSFISTSQLVAVITADDIAEAGTPLVFVFNPPEGGTVFSGGVGFQSRTSCGGKTSNALSFTVNP